MYFTQNNIDIIISQLRTRFMGMNNIVNKFKFYIYI